MRLPDGTELPVLLGTSDFARLMGWGEGYGATRRARRWLKRNNIGRRNGSAHEWTFADLQAHAPAVVDELITRGRIEL